MKSLLVVCFVLISTFGMGGVIPGRSGVGEAGRRESSADRRGGEGQGRARRELNGRSSEERNGESRRSELPPVITQRQKEEGRILEQSIETLNELIRWTKGSYRMLDKEELDLTSRRVSQDVRDAIQLELAEINKMQNDAIRLLKVLQKRGERLSQASSAGQ